MTVLAYYQNYDYTKTVCGRGSIDPNDCVTSGTLSLKVNTYCKELISFESWTIPKQAIGLSETEIIFEKAGTNYFTTSDEVNCPITSFKLEVLEGNEEQITLDSKSGALTVTIVS